MAAESAGTLAAAEMGFGGLPFSAESHRRHLERTLGPRPAGYEMPAGIVAVTEEIGSAFGRPVNPASHTEVLDAFRREGIEVQSTRKHILQEIDHPAVPLLLRHRDLAKLFSTNGWHWLDTWVHGNRFRPVYVPGAVVSGRWASRGGGALQIPKALRSSVVSDPGWTFVVADAGQLEPRILAAMSGDPRMVAAAGEDDLYAPVAATAFAGDRAKAKVAVLGVLYGATSGDSRSLLAVLRKSFPDAVEFVERAAKAGERGEVVHSWLGRACPPAPPGFQSGPDVRARGRFTRNFVVQATAAEWALVLLATLRTRLSGTAAELVLFVHDEVVVHCPRADADRVAGVVGDAAEEVVLAVASPQVVVHVDQRPVPVHAGVGDRRTAVGGRLQVSRPLGGGVHAVDADREERIAAGCDEPGDTVAPGDRPAGARCAHEVRTRGGEAWSQ